MGSGSRVGMAVSSGELKNFGSKHCEKKMSALSSSLCASFNYSFFILFLLSSQLSLADHKIIYLISPPRSLSVAFLRMMDARGDFDVLNEPSQKAHQMIWNPEFAKHNFLKTAPNTFDDVKNIIFERQTKSNVFVKEMSFAVQNFLMNAEEFVRNPNIYFVFLVRNPHPSIISLYKEVGEVFPMFEEVSGYASMRILFDFVRDHAAHAPVIISSESLYTQPEATVRTFCEEVNIPFLPHSLHWKNLGEDFSEISAWGGIKPRRVSYKWHGNAIHSVGFKSPTIYKSDENGRPTFEEIEDDQSRALVTEIYYRNLKHYEYLLHPNE